MLDTTKEWTFNLDSILAFIYQKDGRKRSDSSIEEVYKIDDNKIQDPKLVEKKITELKTADFSARESIRYDLVKWLMEGVDSIEIDDLGNAIYDTLGQKISLSTLLNYGFIIDEE